MKYLLIPAILTVLCVGAAAQHIETLVRAQDEWTFFLQPELKTTRISDKSAQLMGLRLGPALDRRLHIGLTGYALVSSLEPNGLALRRVNAFDLWSAGLAADYTIMPNKVIHPAFGCFIGAGQIRVRRRDEFDTRDNADLFIVEPQASLMVNLTETLELGVGLGYRLVNGSNIRNLTNNDLSGPTGTVFLRWTESHW